MRIISNKFYDNYEDALDIVNLQKLDDRREELCLNFAKKCLENEKTKGIFPLTENKHNMKQIKSEKYVVNFARTERLKNSAIPYMQRMLNNYDQTKK